VVEVEVAAAVEVEVAAVVEVAVDALPSTVNAVGKDGPDRPAAHLERAKLQTPIIPNACKISIPDMSLTLLHIWLFTYIRSVV